MNDPKDEVRRIFDNMTVRMRDMGCYTTTHYDAGLFHVEQLVQSHADQSAGLGQQVERLKRELREWKIRSCMLYEQYAYVGIDHELVKRMIESDCYTGEEWESRASRVIEVCGDLPSVIPDS